MTTPRIALHVGALLLLVTVGCHGDSFQICSYDDAEKVISQWNEIAHSGDGATAMLETGQEIFKILFEKAPGAKVLFKGVDVDHLYGPKFGSHILRVLNGLDILINKLHNKQALRAMLHHLDEQHIVRDGVTKGGFDLLQSIIFENLPIVVSNFDVDSWKNCLDPLFKGMSQSLP